MTHASFAERCAKVRTFIEAHRHALGVSKGHQVAACDLVAGRALADASAGFHGIPAPRGQAERMLERAADARGTRLGPVWAWKWTLLSQRSKAATESKSSLIHGFTSSLGSREDSRDSLWGLVVVGSRRERIEASKPRRGTEYTALPRTPRSASK